MSSRYWIFQIYSYTIILAVFLLNILGNSASAQIITNGDFTEDDLNFSNGSGYTSSSVGQSTNGNAADIMGWTQNAASLVGINSIVTGNETFAPSSHLEYVTPPAFVFLQSSDPEGSSISQSITLAPFTDYTLTFAVAQDGSDPTSGTAVVDVFAGGATLVNLGVGTSPIRNFFTTFTTTFTTLADVGSASITLQNPSVTEVQGFPLQPKVTVDFTNVSIVAVPEPSPDVLLSFGLLALLIMNLRFKGWFSKCR